MKLILIGVRNEDEKKIKTSIQHFFPGIFKILSLKPLEKKPLIEADINYESSHLILMDDQVLPKNYSEASQQIRDLVKPFHASMILLVDKKMKSSSKKMIQEGGAEFLVKPLEKMAIISRVNTFLRLLKEKKKRKASENRFFQVVENMPIIFADYTDGIDAVYANKLGSQIWGMSHDEVMNPPSKWTESIHPDDKDWVMAAIGNLKKDNLYIQYRIIRPDGQLRWIDDSFIPVFDHHGNRIRVFGFGQDITKRKLAEHSLKKSDEHLRSLMETATDFAIYRLMFDKKDPFHPEIIFASPSIMDILGATENGLDVWLNTLHTEDAERIRQTLRKKPVPRKMEETVRVFHPERQEWLWVQIIENHLTDEKGNLTYSNGIMFDVTDRVKASSTIKKRDLQLARQTAKLQKLNDALSILLEHQEKKLKDMQHNMSESLDKLVVPYLQDLSVTELDQNQQTFVDIISSNLINITSSFIKTMSSWKNRLSPTEIRVADLVKNGKNTKEIAELFNVSPAAISFHRNNIRSKLEITNEKVNLASYLQNLGRD
ncbi:PAS domain-containing protein [Desulfobacula sp.]|uniref:PAS domain-containing protein n=1 Tax=Desulfobacula sp. TaxID=2593537 RepID=UPI002628F2C8|nr:PAS domain-containing protein [Desulfobacula sp.]